MIKITGGVYGLRNKRGSVTYKTERDEPFSLPSDEEERLVKRGIAEYIETPGTEEQNGECAISKNMKLADLRNIAKEYGLDCSKTRTKAEVIEAIENAMDKSDGTEAEDDAELEDGVDSKDDAELKDGVDSEDGVPELGAAEPEA